MKKGGNNASFFHFNTYLKHFMSDKSFFKEQINTSYTCKGKYITLGGAMFNGETVADAHVKIPLKSMNRHGLIAGATGTGKTKTLQIMAEQLSEQGVPVLLMDLKGDLSGLAAAGKNNDFITKRHAAINDLPYEPKAVPVELLSLSDEKGVKLRATVSEFGPVLLSKILGLNNTQSGVISLLFKYCDDHGLLLIDLKDLKKVLQFIIGEGKEEIKKEYGLVSSASVSAIMRRIIELEQQGADTFFGEKSFDVQDLVQKVDGKGQVSVLRLTDIQDKPKLFSTFMLCMLAEIYGSFPEEGDMEEPKLVIFIDEAHLVFKEASRALMDQLESIIKLIRSKAVGVYFCTQNPTDIPDDILSQLGLKVQHALRAFTAKDRKAIKKAAENYPESEFYEVDKTITELGIGEAFITALNEKGIPTALAATTLRAPISRMDILSEKEINTLVNKSDLVKKYEKTIDPESAYEILSERIEKAEIAAEREKEKKGKTKTTSRTKRSTKKEVSTLEKVTKNTLVRQLGRVVMREAVRGLLGVFGIKR